MKKFYTVFMAGVALISLMSVSGCSEPSAVETITDKSFTPSYTEEYESCYSVRGMRRCTDKLRFHNDAWKFELAHDTKINYYTDSSQSKTRWVEVSQSEYNTYEIGDTYINEE